MNEQIPSGFDNQKTFKFQELPLDEFGEEFFDEFIDTKKFKEEDFPYIDILLDIPKDILISEYHNFFYSAGDKTVARLLQQIEDWKKETQTDSIKQKIQSAEIYKDITEKYDWSVANSLNRTLQKLPKINN